MTPTQQMEYLKGVPDEAQLKQFNKTIEQGFAVSRGDVLAGSNNIAAPIFEMDGRPIGAVLISVPNDRAGRDEVQKLGRLVRETAQRLSRGAAPKMPAIEVAA
jgi:IclR family acetate operon transcriptional repressor